MFHLAQQTTPKPYGIVNVPIELSIDGMPIHETATVEQCYLSLERLLQHRQVRRSNLKALLLAPEARTDSLVPQRRHYKLRPPPKFA